MKVTKEETCRACPECGSTIIEVLGDGTYACGPCGWVGEDIEYRTIERTQSHQRNTLAHRLEQMDPDELSLGD